MNSESTLSPISRRWLPFLGIIAASAAAHLWCLGSQFYMDDMVQIRDNSMLLDGHLAGHGLSSWSYFCYFLQARLFGMSPVGFHALNWLLHTSVACVLFAFGRDFVREKWPAGVAWFAALLFVVHPLGSEIPNYARTQDLAWATLFSLLAAWFMLRFLRDGGAWKLAGCGLFILGATFSKGPGLIHALMMTSVVGLVCLSPQSRNFLRRRAWMFGAGAVLLIAALWLMDSLQFWLHNIPRWSEPRFIGHGYTLSRVFWEFAWRSVIPVALSSDHLIAETLVPPGTSWWNIPDHGAMLAMAGLLALAGFSIFLVWRKPTRLFGTCLFLYVATILFRVLYLIPEFMPEYRIYPGLPWFCLGAAIILATIWNRLFAGVSPRGPALVLLATGCLLSAKRSFLWHDLDRLTADVLKQYPARARSLWELNERDAAAGNWQAIIARQRDVWPDVERHFVQGNQRLAPLREIPSGDFVRAMVAIFGRYALALAHTENPAAGLRVMDLLEAHMNLMKMDPEVHAADWAIFYHDKGLILETAGNFPAAAAFLGREGVAVAWPADLRRVQDKISSGK